MKKQIFLLSVLFFLSVTMAVGQNVTGALTCPTPNAVDITCLKADALHPVPGTAYTYKVDVPNPTGTKTFKWIVTQEQTFLTNGTLNTTNAESAGGTHIAAAGNELNNVTTDPEGKDISITWKSFVYDASKPVFVVIYVENANACTTQNMKVYKIEPVNAFTLDIQNLAADATLQGSTYSTCVSNIASAKYDPNSPEGVVYDFGTDYLFFAVTAANFTDSWRPSFEVTGYTASQTISVDWAYSSTPTAWNAMTDAGSGKFTTTGQVDAKDATKTVGASGECILVRVTVKHNKEELLANEDIKVAVDGKTLLSATTPVGDVHYSSTLPTANTLCGKEDGFTYDYVTHTLTARPTVNSATGTPVLNFLPNK